MRQYLNDPRTERLFSFQAMYAGLSPQDALAIYAIIAYMDSVAGVYFPKGGMHALPRAHGRRRREARRHVPLLHRGHARRDSSGDRAVAVHTADGERIAADVVVLNPDLPVAYRELLGREPWSVRRLTYSPSCFLLLAGSTATYTKTAHHNIHFGRSWNGVFRELIDEKRLMTDPSILVTNPTYSDPSLAPDGKQIYYVLFPTPEPRRRHRLAHRGPALPRRGGAHPRGARLRRVRRRHRGRARHDAARLGRRAGMERGRPVRRRALVRADRPVPARRTCGARTSCSPARAPSPASGVPMVLVSGRLAAERITGADPAYRADLPALTAPATAGRDAASGPRAERRGSPHARPVRGRPARRARLYPRDHGLRRSARRRARDGGLRSCLHPAVRPRPAWSAGAVLAIGALGVGWLPLDGLADVAARAHAARPTDRRRVRLARLGDPRWCAAAAGLARRSAPTSSPATCATCAGCGPCSPSGSRRSLLAPPLFSRDVYSYFAQGKLVLAGVDPYTQRRRRRSRAGSATASTPCGSDTPTPYGPLFLALSRGVAAFVGEQPYLAVHRVPAARGRRRRAARLLRAAACVPLRHRRARRPCGSAS